jgi:methyl-accepting chemotaxis protein
MIKAINEITNANNEAAGGTQNFAQKTSVVSQKANEIVKQGTTVKESSEKLMQMVQMFKV